MAPVVGKRLHVVVAFRDRAPDDRPHDLRLLDTSIGSDLDEVLIDEELACIPFNYHTLHCVKIDQQRVDLEVILSQPMQRIVVDKYGW